MSKSDYKDAKQQLRLKYIDLCAFVLGYVSRKLVMDRFQVGGAYASRDINEYIRASFGRIAYNGQQKRYEPVEWFSPLFEHDVLEALNLASSGKHSIVYAEDVYNESLHHQVPTSLPELDIVAPALRAVGTRKKVEVKYLSRSSGQTERLIAPHSVICVSHFYYLRAFDHKTGEFRSFKLNRILDAQFMNREPDINMQKAADRDWHTNIRVTIGLHPALTHKAAIEQDYGLVEGKKVLDINKALLLYYLMDWNIAPLEFPDLPATLFPLRVLEISRI